MKVLFLMMFLSSLCANASDCNDVLSHRIDSAIVNLAQLRPQVIGKAVEKSKRRWIKSTITQSCSLNRHLFHQKSFSVFNLVREFAA